MAHIVAPCTNTASWTLLPARSGIQLDTKVSEMQLELESTEIRESKKKDKSAQEWITTEPIDVNDFKHKEVEL